MVTDCGSGTGPASVAAFSRADAAVVQVAEGDGLDGEVRHGMALARWLGVPLAVAVEAEALGFGLIRAQLLELAQRLGPDLPLVLPTREGRNVGQPAPGPGYQGPSLADWAEAAASTRRAPEGSTLEVRWRRGRRVFGHVTGTLRVGDRLRGPEGSYTVLEVLPVSSVTPPDRIIDGPGAVELAGARLPERGACLTSGPEPRRARELEVDVAWVAAQPATRGQTLLAQVGGHITDVRLDQIQFRVDVEGYRPRRAVFLEARDLARIHLSTESGLTIDASEERRRMTLIDPVSHQVVGAARIVGARPNSH